MNYFPELTKFLLQAKEGGLKTKDYIKKLGQLSVRVSFGQGVQARVPWIAFLHDTQDVMRGIYPVLLFYKSQNILILTYGISETHKPLKQWPTNVTNETIQIKDFLSGKQERYGDSFVYKSYKVNLNGDKPTLLKHSTDEPVNAETFDADLSGILDLYIKTLGDNKETASDIVNQGDIEDIKEFGLESHLEDFIVDNWYKLDFAKDYEIYKEGDDVIGKQYVTPDGGRMDILAKKKDGKGWLVIELKKGRTSDKVVGQIHRYIGYVTVHLADEGEEVKGLIIAGQDDIGIKYAVEHNPAVTFLTYSVQFNLDEPSLEK